MIVNRRKANSRSDGRRQPSGLLSLLTRVPARSEGPLLDTFFWFHTWRSRVRAVFRFHLHPWLQRSSLARVTNYPWTCFQSSLRAQPLTELFRETEDALYCWKYFLSHLHDQSHSQEPRVAPRVECLRMRPVQQILSLRDEGQNRTVLTHVFKAWGTFFEHDPALSFSTTSLSRVSLHHYFLGNPLKWSQNSYICHEIKLYADRQTDRQTQFSHQVHIGSLSNHQAAFKAIESCLMPSEKKLGKYFCTRHFSAFL